MITAWFATDIGLRSEVLAGNELPASALWLDVIDITQGEIQMLERTVGVKVPTRLEMQEIEMSSRLYSESAAVFMTTTTLIKTDTDLPEESAVTYILTGQRLVTIRYAQPWSFSEMAQRAATCGLHSADLIFATLFEITVGRLADRLEEMSAAIERISQRIFTTGLPEQVSDQQVTMAQIGRSGHICTMLRESLVDKGRVMIFAEPALAELISPACRARLQSCHRDITALSDQATFNAGKISFLLDANVGLITIEQNRIIKIFSIAAVLFMPPTMIASIYGMNFKGMPELGWHYGYEYALLLMAASVIGTLVYFKCRRWF